MAFRLAVPVPPPQHLLRHLSPRGIPTPATGRPPSTTRSISSSTCPRCSVRLLLPETLAYNIWIALPVPLAALRHVPVPAPARDGARPSALGAVAFAVSGPIVSHDEFPEHVVVGGRWCPTCSGRSTGCSNGGRPARSTLLAAVVACQALAGEPVSLAATLVIAGADAAVIERRGATSGFGAGRAPGCRGVLLVGDSVRAAVGLATRTSARGHDDGTTSGRSIRSRCIELLVPHFFGDYFNSNLRELAWMIALNSERDPSTTRCTSACRSSLLAAVAVSVAVAGTRFWTIVIVVCAIASLARTRRFTRRCRS